MKEKLRNNILYLLFMLLMLTAGACGHKAEKHAGDTNYTCPMHPQIVQDEPGSCPVCGMDLVPTSRNDEHVASSDDLDLLLEPTNRTVISSMTTVTPVEKAVQASVEMEGIITYDERRIFTISAQISGRIERLFVNYNFQPIKKGQKLMEVYSPELITAQKELLYLVQSAPEDKQLIASSKQKLRLLGATDAQINRLIRSGEASYTFAIYSPYDGYVIGLNASAPAASAGTINQSSGTNSTSSMNNMGGNGSAGFRSPATDASSAGGDGIQLREGMYIRTGQPLLKIVDPNQLWAEFNISAGEVNSLAKGAPIQITFPQLPSENLTAKIDFIQPFFEAGENFAKVRVYLPGQQRLAMAGQLVSGKASYRTESTLWVPKAAVVDIGTRSVAFKKTGKVFEPIAVVTGIVKGNEIQIMEGLQRNDKIAANAQFMVDSESFINLNK